MEQSFRYIENEGAIFRTQGPSNAFPSEVWNPFERKFEPYLGEVPKPVSWGAELDYETFKALIS
jgi:hypothetical protein